MVGRGCGGFFNRSGRHGAEGFGKDIEVDALAETASLYRTAYKQ